MWKRQRNGTFTVISTSACRRRKAVPSPRRQAGRSANRFTGDYDDPTPPLSAADGVLNSACATAEPGLPWPAVAQRAAAPPRCAAALGESRILAYLAAQPRYTLGDTRYAESARSGDLGYTWSTYQLARRAAGASKKAARWTRQKSGQWQVAIDVLQRNSAEEPLTGDFGIEVKFGPASEL